MNSASYLDHLRRELGAFEACLAGDPDPYRVHADSDSGDEPDAGSRPDSTRWDAESGGSRGPLGDYPAAGDDRARYSRRE